MDQRTKYLIQILENIGSPLMTAILQVAGRDNNDDAQDAQKMAVLLAKTVQTSIELGNSTDLSRVGVADDSIRVALAGLASPLIAAQYESGSKIPDDAAIKRMVAALQAVMTFSENFTPSPQNTERLENIAAKGQVVSAHQVDVQYLQAFIPVVNAIGSFSFGQSEQKLIMDIAERLVAKAVEIREALAQNLSEDDQKFTELAILRALTPLYAACHTAETERMAGASMENDNNSSLNKLWNNFEARASMLETLAKNLLPGKTVTTTASNRALSAPPVQQSPTQPATPPLSPPPAETAPNGANPMSMFAKPKTDTPPQIPQPPAAPPSPPPAIPPADSSPPTQATSSPMSFFKAPAKKDGEA